MRASHQSHERRGDSGQWVGEGKLFSAGFLPQKWCFHPMSSPREPSELHFIRYPWFGAELAECFCFNLSLPGGEGPRSLADQVLWGILNFHGEGAGGLREESSSSSAPQSVSHSEPGSLLCQKAPPQQDLGRCGCSASLQFSGLESWMHNSDDSLAHCPVKWGLFIGRHIKCS